MLVIGSCKGVLMIYRILRDYIKKWRKDSNFMSGFQITTISAVDTYLSVHFVQGRRSGTSEPYREL